MSAASASEVEARVKKLLDFLKRMDHSLNIVSCKE
jgi:hypothetical protein